MASFQQAISSVNGQSMINWFIFGHWVVIHLTMQQQNSTNFTKIQPNMKRFAFLPFCLFSQQLSNHSIEFKDTSKFATIAVHFVDNLIYIFLVHCVIYVMLHKNCEKQHHKKSPKLTSLVDFFLVH